MINKKFKHLPKNLNNIFLVENLYILSISSSIFLIADLSFLIESFSLVLRMYLLNIVE